jgi:hypothetical protein
LFCGGQRNASFWFSFLLEFSVLVLASILVSVLLRQSLEIGRAAVKNFDQFWRYISLSLAQGLRSRFDMDISLNFSDNFRPFPKVLVDAVSTDRTPQPLSLVETFLLTCVRILHRDLNAFVEATQYLVCASFSSSLNRFSSRLQFLHLETIVRPSPRWKTVQRLVSFLVCAEFRFSLSVLLLSSRFSSLHLETILAETLILCGGQCNASFRFSFLLEF